MVVNGAFRSQRVTGQQRYATEIADRLIALGVQQLVPGPFWSASALRTWLWTIAVLPLRARDAVLISLTSRAPVLHPAQIVAVHDLFVLTNPEWYSRLYRITHAAVLKLQLRNARGAVVVSRPVLDQLQAWLPSVRRPLAVAPNAPSPVFAGSAATELPSRLGVRDGAFLLTVGSRDPRKNFARLARSWSAVPEDVRGGCPLVVVGGSGASFATTEVDWPSGTILAGYVADEELAGLYASARAVVFVSLAEGFGLPIVEAAAAGATRLVLSDIEVFRWIAGKGPLYVDPQSELAITDALRSSATKPNAAQATVDVSAFDWDESARSVLGVATTVRRLRASA